MNKHEKEVERLKLAEEEKILKNLKRQYMRAANDVAKNIKLQTGKIDSLLTDFDNLSDEDKSILRSVAYRREFQKQLKEQIDGVLDVLNTQQEKSIRAYLDKCYEIGFGGAVYNMHNQGIPLILQIDQREAVKAVTLDPKLSNKLYGAYTRHLKTHVRNEISRGIVTGDNYTNIARNIANRSNQGFNRAMTIVRTEGHRIHMESSYAAMTQAKEKGADIVKQWDSTMDGKTRKSHRKLDGQIRELDEPFEVDGKKVMFPSKFGRPEEDINCRCTVLQRAKWGLDEDELETLKERAKFFELDKAKDFDDFKKKYLNASKAGSIMTFNDIFQEYKDNAKVIRTTVHNVEDGNKGLDHEVATIVDKHGMVVLVAGGERGKVEVPLDALKDSILTHNHPDGGSFSDDDVRSFVEGNLFEVRATTPDGTTYSLRKGKAETDPKIADDFEEAMSISRIYEIIKADYDDGKLSWDEAADYNTVVKYRSDYGEKWLKENAEKYGYVFEVGEV